MNVTLIAGARPNFNIAPKRFNVASLGGGELQK